MNIAQAVDSIKKSDKARFDSTIEAHINCVAPVRFSLTLPHGTGKSKKIAVMAGSKVKDADLELAESDIGKIESGEIKPKSSFEILIVEPRFMPKLAKVAKILGPAGLMPNPKNGTVTDDVQKAVSQFKKGRLEIKSDPTNVVHTILGKKSFTTQALLENFSELMSALASHEIKSVFVSATMSPSVKVDL